jgi:hypothetical protein
MHLYHAPSRQPDAYLLRTEMSGAEGAGTEQLGRSKRFLRAELDISEGSAW